MLKTGKEGRKTLIALYGYSICSLALKADHKLQVFVDEEFRKILLRNKDEVLKLFLMLHKEEGRDAGYRSLSVVLIVKYRRRCWARMGTQGTRGILARGAYTWAKEMKLRG